MEDIKYKNITASVRSPKVVVLINKDDKYWKYSIQRIIEYYSQMWGGGYNLIVPTDGKTIDDKFWTILEKFSPDYIYSYFHCVLDLEKSDKNFFNKISQKQKDTLRQKFPSMSDKDIDDHVSKEASISSYLDFKISETLSQELKNRLSPFYFEQHIVKSVSLSRGKNIGFPLTSIKDIILNTDLKEVYDMDVDRRVSDIDVKMYLYSQLGSLTDEYQKSLKDLKLNIKKIPKNYSTSNIIEDLVNGGVDFSFIKLKKDLSEELNKKENKEWSPTENYLEKIPFSVSLVKLGKYYKVQDHHDWKEPVVLIVGDTIYDFCYYYNLSRIHENIHWISKKLIDKCNKSVEKIEEKKSKRKHLSDIESVPCYLINGLYKKIDYGTHEKRIVLSSLSLNDADLLDIKSKLVKVCLGGGDISKSIDVDLKKDFTYCSSVLIEQNNYDKQQTLIFSKNESISGVETPKPKNFNYIHPSNHRWITELKIQNYNLPVLHFLGRHSVMSNSRYESRISNEGICYLCPNIAYFGGDIDIVLSKPKLKLVEPLDIFKEYYCEAGYKKVNTSDKGLLSRRSLELFGSLDIFGQFFLKEENRKLIDKFVNYEKTFNKDTGEEIVKLKNPNIKTEIKNEEGIVVIKNDTRNYLNFKAIQETIGDISTTADFVDDLIKKNIVNRGLILHCEACYSSDWYNIDNVGTTFRCNRCGKEQIITHDHCKQPDEPRWYYKLNEVIREGFRQHMDVPLMTLYFLKRNSKESFMYVPELCLWEDEFNDGNCDIEIDINCIVDGRMVIGEAKSNKLKIADINDYSKFISKLKKYPDQIVFSTMQNNWSTEIVSKIEELKNSKIIFQEDLLNIKK